MSVFKVTTQGGVLVTRDEKGRVVARSEVPAPVARKKQPINWRKQLREATETEEGNILIARAINIALGNPQRAMLPDGSYTEWTVPSISEQRQTLQFLLEMDKGKAVAQTEIVKAEMESEDLAQYRAISDEELAKAAREYLERNPRKALDEPKDKGDASE